MSEVEKKVTNVAQAARRFVNAHGNSVYVFRMAFQSAKDEGDLAGKQRKARGDLSKAVTVRGSRAVVLTEFVQEASKTVMGRVTEHYCFVHIPHGQVGEPVRRAAIACFGAPVLTRTASRADYGA